MHAERGLPAPNSPLCGTAIPGCAPLSAPSVHRDSVLAAASPTRHSRPFALRMVLRDESVGLRRETASSPRFMRRNLSSGTAGARTTLSRTEATRVPAQIATDLKAVGMNLGP